MSPEPLTDVLLLVDDRLPPEKDARAQLVATLTRCVAAESALVVGVIDLGSAGAATIEEIAGPVGDGAAPLVLLDAAALSVATLYGDLVAARTAAVLRAPTDRVLGVRLDAAGRRAAALGLRSQPPARTTSELLEAVEAVAAAAGPTLEVDPGELPLVVVGPATHVADALAQLAGVDEPALRLRRASRGDDGFLSTFLVRPLSRRVTAVAVRHGVRPASATAVALALGLAAAAAYAGGGLGFRLLGSLLLLGSLVVDCVDGEVARYTRTTSPLGGWLDVGADRVKEYAVYAGLAAGVAGAGRVAWLLALASLALLVSRHFVDFGYAATRADAGVVRATVAEWSARTSAKPALMWAKRAVIMPVGERTVLLIVLAPLAGARWTLGALLALGVVATAWTTAGRVGRTLMAAGWAGVAADGPSSRRLAAQVDGSPVPPRAWPVTARAGWLLPAGARVLEQGGCALVVAFAVPAAVPAAYAWLAVVAFAQYDVVYRQRLAGAVTGSAALRGFGWPLRTGAVVVLALAAPAALATALAVGALVLGLAVLGATSAFWSRWVPSTP